MHLIVLKHLNPDLSWFSKVPFQVLSCEFAGEFLWRIQKNVVSQVSCSQHMQANRNW
jgi:hypothetical protein